MATYLELFQIGNDTAPELAQRIKVAIVVKAQIIAADAQSTAAQNEWAISALRNPAGDMQAVLNYLLAANRAATVVQITGADDAAVQTAVDNAVDQLLGA